jgi:Domain of unknown function (DUF4214)
MRPLNILAHRIHIASNRFVSRTIKAMLLSVLVACFALAMYVKVDSSRSSAATVTVQAAGRGKPYLNLQDGREMQVEYVGDQRLGDALRSGQARARALASADLDHNGTPDVVAGYAYNGTGILTVQRGNTDAFAPDDDSVFVRMQAGYNPDSLVPTADTYQLPETPDFLAVGNFNGDTLPDVLFARRDGGLYLMTGENNAAFGLPSQMALPGRVMTLAVGQFCIADGRPDLVVAVLGQNGPELLIYRGTSNGLATEPLSYRLSADVTAIDFGTTDDDPFQDIVAAAGNEVIVIHGWGVKGFVEINSRIERIPANHTLGIALGNFVWDREARNEIAALSSDGSVHIIERETLDPRPFSEQDLAERRALRRQPVVRQTDEDIESAASWQAATAEGWNAAREIRVSDAIRPGLVSQGLLLRSHISFQETDELLVLDGDARRLEIVRQRVAAKEGIPAAELPSSEDLTVVSLDITTSPAAVIALPQKLNGERNLVLFQTERAAATLIPLAPTATIAVDRPDDVNVSTCGDQIDNDNCSLRGSVTYANANPGTTINVPAGLYVLSLAGGAGGCDSNTGGDLTIDQTTTIVGGGAASTIIRQQDAAANQRVMCLNLPFTASLNYNFSALTMTGGRDPSGIGGGGIVGGALSNTLTLTNVTVSNNQASGAGTSGGAGVNIFGGSVTLTNCTIGGTSAPGADRTIVAQANSTTGPGGGLAYGPGNAGGLGGSGTLIMNGSPGSTLQNNTAGSAASGGGGADLTTINMGTGSFDIQSGTFTSNSATAGNGGGIIVEALGLTLSSTTMNTNHADDATLPANRGGAIFMSGGGLTFGSSTSFSGNTAAVTTGSCISTNGAVTVTGTGNNINDNVEVLGAGNWTNNAGTSVTFLNLNIIEGTFTANNSTLNVTNNLNLLNNSGGDACLFNGDSSTMTVANLDIQEGTFNASSGTTNVTGNFSFTGAVFTNNAGTFNFNGTGAQGITGGVTFGNFTMNKSSGTLTLNNSISVAGNLNLTAGTLNLQGFTANRTVAGGTLTVSNGVLLRIGGTQTLPSNYSTHSIGATSTIEYSGSSQSVATLNSAQSYGNLLTSGSGTKTVAGTIGVVTSLTIGSGTVLDGGANTINVAGNWVNNAGVGGFTSTGTVDFNGAGAQSITGATTFNNLTKSGAGTLTLGANITATGNVNLNAGTWNASSFTLNVGGNWNRVGTFTPGTGLVNFNGGTQSITGVTTFNDLTISSSNTVSLLNDETVTGTLTLTNGVLAVGTNTLTLNGPVSFTSGSISSSSTGTVNYNKSSDVQNVAPGAYGHLTFSNFSKTLPASIITIAGIFSPGSSTGHTITGNTIEFNGGGAQTIPAFNYNNLASSGAGARTLASSGTIGIAGVFTPGPNVYTINGSTIDFNGAGAQTVPAFNYNNLTVSNTHGANPVTLINGGTIGVGATFTPGTSTFTITNNTMNFNGAGAQTVPAFPYNNLTISNTHGANPVTLVNGGTIGVAATFTPGTSTFVVTNNTMNFNGAGAQTVPVFNYFHLTLSGNRGGAAITLASGNIGVAGNNSFAATNNTYVTTGNTVIFNGNDNTQTLSGNPTFNNLTINHTGTGNVTAAGSTLTVSGLLQTQTGTFISSSTLNNVQIDSGTTLQSDGGQMNVSGNWTNNGGTFTPNGNTVNFNGSGAQTIDGSSVTTFNNLTIANAGSGVSMGQNANVNGVLTLTNDLTTGANIVTMPASGTSAGARDVIGNVKRTGFTGGGPALSFGNPFNSISFIVQGTVPTDITVNLVKAAPSGAQAFSTAVLRTYTITPNGGSGYSATVRLHYQSPGDLNGNNPATMNLWRFDSGLNQWRPNPATARDCAAGCTTNLSNFWAERSGVTVFSPWTLNSTTPTAGPAIVSGRITSPDGSPLGGAVLRLNGAQSVTTVTDGHGNYRFENVETNNFYTVTPSLANYSFSPASRSFSLTGNMTDAGFTANPDTSQSANAIDTIEYFVRQQYLDFLGREPDQGGFDYWASQFDVCNGDATCIRNKRIDVSAAFFASVEFQQTGSYIYGLYVGTLGRTLNYGEFNADRSQVLGGAGLDPAKTAFAQEFVQRPEFTQRYPQGMTREEFVDAVLQTMQQRSGIDPSSLRNGLLGDYDVGGRALVARHASEASAFVAAEYNKAFVLMEYFGYLRRDVDPGGYAFWLDVNNGAPNNYRGMVCSFLTSAEYQARFATVITHTNAECGQ